MILTDSKNLSTVILNNHEITNITIRPLDPEDRDYIQHKKMTLMDRIVYRLIGCQKYAGVKDTHNACICIQTINDDDDDYSWIIFISCDITDEEISEKMSHLFNIINRGLKVQDMIIDLTLYDPLFIRSM